MCYYILLLKIYQRSLINFIYCDRSHRINGVLPSALSRFSANSNSFLLSTVRLRLSIVFRKHCSAFAWQVPVYKTENYGQIRKTDRSLRPSLVHGPSDESGNETTIFFAIWRFKGRVANSLIPRFPQPMGKV